MVLGVIALIFAYLTAHEIYGLRFTIYRSSSQKPDPKNVQTWFATTVALLVATQPMYAFITASVANETANIATCAVVVWLAQRYVLYGPTPHVWRAVALGVTLGLVSLSKMTGLSVGLVAVAAFLQTAIATRKQPGTSRLLWRDGIIIGALFLLVGGWWYWRNYQLYGDFFQQGLYKIYFNVDPQPLTLSQFVYTLSTGEVSFWATFGWLNIVAPDWVYTVYRVISRVGLLGVIVAVIVQFWRGRQEADSGVAREMKHETRNTNPASQISHPTTLILHPLLLHLIFPIALAFSLTRLVATEGGLQGRQLLPALGSIAIVIMWGWWALTTQKTRRWVLGTLFAVLLGLAAWLPLSVVACEYIPRPLLTEVDMPQNLTRLDWRYNDDMKLLGVEIDTTEARPGERVPVTAYWQALRPMDTNYSVFVHLIGRNYQTVGQFNTYPALGLRPTTTLQPGQIIADTYPVLINGGSEAPTRLLVNIGLFDFNEPGRPGIPATAPNGNAVGPTVAQLKLLPNTWPSSSGTSPLALFSDNIQLDAATIEGCTTASSECAVNFFWSALDTPSRNYTVFVQLWQNGQFVTGFDTPPLNNDYPTSLWTTGEIIADSHTLDLTSVSPGTYQILTGLYNFETGDRLPASLNGEPLQDFAVDLGEIRVE